MGNFHPRAGPFHSPTALPKYCSPLFHPQPLQASQLYSFLILALQSQPQPSSHASPCSGESPPPPCFNLHHHPSPNHLFEQFNGLLIKYCISAAPHDGIISPGIPGGMHKTAAQHCPWLSLCAWAASPAAAPWEQEGDTALNPAQSKGRSGIQDAQPEVSFGHDCQRVPGTLWGKNLV